MNPSRILPDLQCSLVAEDVRQEINGNFILSGIISMIRVPKMPVVAFRLFIFNRWTAGVGKFREVVRLVGPDQATVLRQGQTEFNLQNPAQAMTNVTLFAQVQLPAAGVYFIEVLVDDVMKLRYPLPVVLVQKPGQEGQPGAGGPAAQVEGGVAGDGGTASTGETPPSGGEKPQQS
ncbi:MAG: DUF6941 family protein [Limisphaerales bacterium]|jgi:hypothetical protein